MSIRLINVDRQTPMLLPPDLRDWVPEGHMVHFILEAIDHLDLSSFRLNWRGSGSEQYPPATMLALLVYCYATARFGSRRIEEATYSDVVVRYKRAGEMIEDDGQTTVYAAVEKQVHGRTVARLEKGEEPPPPDEHASMTEQMRWRLRTKKGKERYKLRKQTVEPVFGVIKKAMGFRQFHLRGSPKVELEWDLVTLAYNMRRMFKLVGEKSLPQPGWLHSYGY